MLLFYLALTGSGLAALASIWFALWQDAHRFVLCLGAAILLAMLSEVQHRASRTD
jgi:hypothetical protein